MTRRPFVLRPATQVDWPAIAALLASHALPLDGAAAHLDSFVVAVERRTDVDVDVDAARFAVAAPILGVAGLERSGDAVLLRSVAVAGEAQGRGIADALVRALLDDAQCQGAREAWLLTTTAAAWFSRRGFAPAPRAQAPEGLRASAEFTGACPAGATSMRRLLPAG